MDRFGGGQVRKLIDVGVDEKWCEVIGWLWEIKILDDYVLIISEDRK